MSNIAVVRKEGGLPALQMDEKELMDVLRNSLYVGAKDSSIKMVMGYCAAAGLDVMQKPVHLVPMWDSKAGEMRDVVMPGIGLYRTQAARSGEYAGVTEPEYGDDIEENIGGVKITYPAWCKVTVKRLLPNGTIAEFSATERWKENYAVKGGKDKSIAPNTMWIKRPYGQIAKCAEAQALRKAFPEFGSQPTNDEMEGKALDESMTVEASATEVKKPALPECTTEKFDQMCVDVVDADGEITRMGWKSLVSSGTKEAAHLLAMLQTKYVFSDEQIKTVKSWESANANA
jgi:phage recombination protein Bet